MKLVTQNKFSGRSFLSASLVCLALVGCGGGDGDGDTAFDFEPVVIADFNMADIAGAVIMTNSVGSSLVGGTDVLPGVQTTSAPASPAYLLAELAVKKFDSVKDKLASTDIVSGTELPPIILECLNFDGNTGYMSLTLDDRDDNLEVSVGDVITLTANNCQEDDNGVLQTLTGTLRMTLTSISDTMLGLTAQYINLSSTGLTS